MAPPHLRITPELIQRSTALVNSIFARWMVLELQRYDVLIKSLHIQNIFSRPTDFCEPSKPSTASLGEKVSDYCLLIETQIAFSGMSLSITTLKYIPYIIAQVSRNLLQKREDGRLSFVDVELVGPELVVMHLELELHRQWGVATDDQHIVEVSLELFLRRFTDIAFVKVTKVTGMPKRALFEIAVFGEDCHECESPESRIIFAFQEHRSYFNQALKISGRKSIQNATFFDIRKISLPTHDLTLGTPFDKTSGFDDLLVFQTIGEPEVGLSDVRLWMAMMLWFTIGSCLLAVTLGPARKHLMKEKLSAVTNSSAEPEL
jgi:hypothetical protein